MQTRSTFFVLAFVACWLANISEPRAEIGGTLTTELAGTTITYNYTSGRKYRVTYGPDTLAYLRMDVPGRTLVEGLPYIARKIDTDVYYISWHRPERGEFVTILIDLGKRMLYTSALLEGNDRHFDLAEIVDVERPKQ